MLAKSGTFASLFLCRQYSVHLNRCHHTRWTLIKPSGLRSLHWHCFHLKALHSKQIHAACDGLRLTSLSISGIRFRGPVGFLNSYRFILQNQAHAPLISIFGCLSVIILARWKVQGASVPPSFIQQTQKRIMIAPTSAQKPRR